MYLVKYKKNQNHSEMTKISLKVKQLKLTLRTLLSFLKSFSLFIIMSDQGKFSVYIYIKTGMYTTLEDIQKA